MRWDWDNHILMPECGITKNLFHRLLNYISVFDSMWADRIRPASPSDIEMFIQIIEQSSYPGKKEIPSEYYAFLEQMGEDDGGLLTEMLPDSIISRANLNHLYWERVNKHYPELKCCPYVPFLFNSLGDAELSYDLSSENPKKIVITYRDELYASTSDTLEKLLFRCAFRKFYLPNAARFAKTESEKYCYSTFSIDTNDAYNRFLPTSNDFLKFITQIETRFSFTEVWFSNKEGYFNDCYIGISADNRMIISVRHYDDTLFGTISGYAIQDIWEVKNFLSSYSQIELDPPNSYLEW